MTPYLEYKQTVFWRREFFCMLRIKQRSLHLMTSLFTFSKERLTLLQNTKYVLCATGHDFSVESTASAIMSETFIALKVNI